MRKILRFNLFNKIKFKKIITGFTFSYITYKYNLINNFKLETLNNNNELTEIETYHKDQFQDNIPLEKTIIHNNKTFTFIIIKKDNKFFALGGICSADYESLLKDGVIFGNKITSPSGSSYNLETGTVETPPSIFNLPIFSTYINDKGNVVVRIPEKIPKFLSPYTSKKEINDIRKIVIIGTGASSIGCAETLRQNGYEGEITLLTNEVNPPINKDYLTKYFKDKSDKDFYYRKGNMEKELDLNIYYGNKVDNFYIKNDKYYLKMEDEFRVEFDAVLIASGSESKINDRLNSLDNFYYINNYFKHKYFIKYIENIETPNIVILGYNWKSIESACNMKREFPISKITILDENLKNEFANKYGFELNKLVKNYLKTLGIELKLQKKILRYKEELNNNKVNEIILKNGDKIKIDALISYNNYNKGNNNFLTETKFAEDLNKDQNNRIIVDNNFNTFRRRIFAAGSCCVMPYLFGVNEYYYPKNFNSGFLQGLTAAYNILGFDVPFHYIPSYWINSYSLNLFRFGFHEYYDNLKIFGNIDENDFMILYSIKDKVVSGIGSKSYKKQLDIIQESIKIGINTQISTLHENNFQEIHNKILKMNKSGCYKDELFKIRYNSLPEKSIWRNRDLLSEEFSQEIIEKDDLNENVLKDEKIISN